MIMGGFNKMKRLTFIYYILYQDQGVRRITIAFIRTEYKSNKLLIYALD
jgi:hypothetical protein